MATAIGSHHQAHTPAGEVAIGVYQVGISAGAGALAGYAFSLINPIGGAIFGATYAVANSIGRALVNQFEMDETATKTSLYTLSYIVSIGLGILATAAAGFPLTLFSGIAMTFAMGLTTIIVQVAANCIGNANRPQP